MVKFMTGFWKDAHDEGGLAWDDTNNNRAFLSQTIAATLNGASIYIESLRNPDKYISGKGCTAERQTSSTHHCQRGRLANSRCTPTTRTCCQAIPKTKRRRRSS